MRWNTPLNGGSVITGFTVRVLNAATGAQIGALRPATAAATSLTVNALPNGTALRFQVAASNAVGPGAFSTPSNTVIPTSAPLAPLIGTASPGLVGGAVNALARWTPPPPDGGPPVNGYQVTALRISATGAVVGHSTSAIQAATARSLRMTLPPGNYRFVVRARNLTGLGATSTRSNLVTAR